MHDQTCEQMYILSIVIGIANTLIMTKLDISIKFISLCVSGLQQEIFIT